MGTTTWVPASLGTEACRPEGGLGTGDAAGQGLANPALESLLLTRDSPPGP